jgi:hypothetical protein
MELSPDGDRRDRADHSGLVTGVRRGKETAYSLAGRHAARIAQDAFANGQPGQDSRRRTMTFPALGR